MFGSNLLKLARQRWKRLTICLLVMGVVFWLISSYAVAYRLTRRPRALCEEPVPTIDWGAIESVRLDTRDGEQLGAWFVAGQSDKPAILLLHGYAQCRQQCLEQAEIAASLGCSTLLVSMRAHGDSTGDFNDFGYSARLDVIAALDWLENRTPGKAIVVWGQSLGSAAAIFAADELGDRVHAYILECPYQDLRTAVRNRTKVYLPLGIDTIAYSGLLTVASLVLDDVDRLSPLHAAEAMPTSAPVLILAGSADRRALPEEARAIHSRIRGPAELVIIAGADHSQLLQADPTSYRKAVLTFLDTCGATLSANE